jgi:hypothetical protein
MAVPAEILEWPGKGSGNVYTLDAGQENTLSAYVQPTGTRLRWLRIVDGVEQPVGAAAGDYVVSADGSTLTIKSPSKEEHEKGTWVVAVADRSAGSDRKEFQIKVREALPAAALGTDPGGGGTPDPLDEWDKSWAGKTLGAALVAVLVLVAAVAASVFAVANASDSWHADRIPAAVVIVLLVAGSVALAAALALAALELRGRARARPAAVTAVKAAATRGGAAVVEPVLKAGTDLLKAFGTLKEPAALAATALALFGGAFALAWVKFPDETAPAANGTTPSGPTGKTGPTASPAAVAVGLRAGKPCAVSLRVDGKPTRAVKPGEAVVTINDASRLCGVTLAGGGLLVVSGWRHTGKTSQTVTLKPRMSYRITMQQVKPGTTRVKNVRSSEDLVVEPPP